MKYPKTLRKIWYRLFPEKIPSADKDGILKLIKKLKPLNTQCGLIRLGGDKDGGYLLPDDLKGIEACFSPGVGNVSEFEYQCEKLGMDVFMADASVDVPNGLTDSMHFIKKYIGVQKSHDFIKMEDWISETSASKDSDLLLQMDIEGHEYDVLLDINFATQRRFRIMVIEFHLLNQLWNGPYFDKAYRAFNKLLKTHKCVHIHPNNCCGSLEREGIEIPAVAEFTFYRNDGQLSKTKATNFPHPLDVENTENEPLVLSEIWYK